MCRVWRSVDKWFLSYDHFHLYPKVTCHYEPISIQKVVQHQHQWGHVWTCQTLNVSTSSTPLASSHSTWPCLYMPAITWVRLSRTISVSRSWILFVNSIVNLLHSPSSFSICFLFSRSSFKRSISNSNMRSLTDDILTSNEMWQIQQAFISCCSCRIFQHLLLLLLISIHKPPIHSLFFQIRQLGQQLDLFQWRMLTCVVEISFQKHQHFAYLISSFLLSVSSQYHAHPSDVCERTFPIHRHIHTLDTRKPCCQLAVTPSNEVIHVSLSYLSNPHYCKLIQVIPIFHKIINQFVIVIYISSEVHQ